MKTKNVTVNCKKGKHYEKKLTNQFYPVNPLQNEEVFIWQKKWKTFGLNDKEIKIYYPELTTFEGKLFYQFLLITANDGDYPKEETQLESSQEYVESFLEKSKLIIQMNYTLPILLKLLKNKFIFKVLRL